MVTSVKDVGNIVGQISVSFERQEASISIIESELRGISSSIESNSATAQESAAASEEMSAQAVKLNEEMNEYSLI